VRTGFEIGQLVFAGLVPCLAYMGVGFVLVRALGLPARRSEALALAFVLGSGTASLLLLSLGLAGIHVPLWAVAVMALLLAPAWRMEWGRAADRAGWVRGVDAASVTLGGLTFLSALGPETWWDGFEYHLPMIEAWSAGAIRALPGMVDAEFRAGADLLYLPAVGAGASDAAAAISAGFACALAALVRAEVRRATTSAAAALAGAFALVVPLTLDNAASTYVDLAVGAYGFVALAAAHRWNRAGQAHDLLLAALCIAFAANAKLHAAVLVPAVLAMVSLGGRPIGLTACVRYGAIVALLTLPWLVKQGITTGNPFFPFFGEWLGTGGIDPDHLALRRYRLSTDFASSGPLAFPHYLASLSFGRNPHVSGLLGALPLALLPAAIRRTDRAGAVLVATLSVLFVLQFLFMPALRFGVALLPFVATACAVGGLRIARSGRGPAALLAGAILMLGLHHTAAALARHGPRVAALQAPEAYKARIFPDQVALAGLVAQGHGVVAIPKGAVHWMPKPVYLTYWERNGELFFEPVRGNWTPPDTAFALLTSRGVRSVVVEAREAPALAGRLHPTVDQWLADGRAFVRPGVPPAPGRGDRIYVLVDLILPTP
jgi:hypothetical protein